jgi:hypothetical protein
MGLRILVAAACLVGCQTAIPSEHRGCASDFDCSGELICVGSPSLGVHGRARGICTRSTFPEWRQSRPCANTSDCSNRQACFADLVWECSDTGCAEKLRGRCLEEHGSHRECRGSSDCALGEDCGHSSLLICNRQEPCHIGLLGWTRWSGRDWGGAKSSLCVRHEPKRWVNR